MSIDGLAVTASRFTRAASNPLEIRPFKWHLGTLLNYSDAQYKEASGVFIWYATTLCISERKSDIMLEKRWPVNPTALKMLIKRYIN